MADPTKYSRGYSFSNFQANTPNRPLPAPSLDTELDNVADKLGEAVDAIKDIRRSDGKIKAGSIDAASLTTDLVNEIVDDALTEAAASATAAAASETAAAASALAADASADAAAASEVEAEAAAATSVANAALLGVWRGPWVTATAYAAGDRVSNAGNTYYATVAHTSAALFSTDLSALRWGIVAEKGASGAGTGDLLAAQNLNDVANKATARSNLVVPETSTVLLKAGNLSGLASVAAAQTNLGLGAMAAKTNVAFTDLAGAAVITEAEGISSNANDTTLPTSAAVKDYADSVGRVLLATKTASASATLDFTEFDNATYRYYEFEFENVKPATDSVGFRFRTSINAGSSYDAGASDYSGASHGVAEGAGIGGAYSAIAYGLIVNAGVGNAAGERGVTGNAKLYNAGESGGYARTISQVTFDWIDGKTAAESGSGTRKANGPVDALRFLFSSGNIASGTIRMYGVVG